MLDKSHEPERSPNEAMIHTALEYLKLGYRPIPLVTGTKRAEIKWKEYQARPPNEENVWSWFSVGEPNVALLTGNGVVVVDVDDPALTEAVIDHCGATPMKCQTPGGGLHLYYAMRPGVHYGNAVRIKGKPIDLRCEAAYVVCPPSRNESGVSYRWLGEPIRASDLPLIKVSWLRERKPGRLITPASGIDGQDIAVRRARAYLARIEGAISGQRGHDRTFRVACVLAIKFGLTLDQAWPLFLEWNSQCEPPWSQKELLHKLQDALKLRFVS
jgi:hypothetical protein